MRIICHTCLWMLGFRKMQTKRKLFFPCLSPLGGTSEINVIMTLRGEGVYSRAMTLELQLQLVVKERKVAIIMRIPNHIMLRAIVRNTVNVCGQRL